MVERAAEAAEGQMVVMEGKGKLLRRYTSGTMLHTSIAPFASGTSTCQ